LLGVRSTMVEDGQHEISVIFFFWDRESLKKDSRVLEQ
jgi:hypothetical protein